MPEPENFQTVVNTRLWDEYDNDVSVYEHEVQLPYSEDVIGWAYTVYDEEYDKIVDQLVDANNSEGVVEKVPLLAEGYSHAKEIVKEKKEELEKAEVGN